MNYRTEPLSSMDRIEQLSSDTVIDILLLSASVDRRGYMSLAKLHAKSIQPQRIIVFDYAKFRPNKDDTDAWDAYYSLSGSESVQYVTCNGLEDDCSFLSEMSIDPNSSVYLDMTCFSIPDVFRIIFVLKECLSFSCFNVIYTEPKYYYYQNGIDFTYEQHLGELDYKPILEYFTSAVSRDVILVCFLGFDRYISKYIYDRKEHSDVVPINGFPAFYPKLKDISLQHNYELLSTLGHGCVKYAQANDPFSAYNTLTAIKSKHPDALLDLCVLGSKPMALGASIFALKNQKQVKVSYPFPTQYCNHTTLDAAHTWVYRFAL